MQIRGLELDAEKNIFRNPGNTTVRVTVTITGGGGKFFELEDATDIILIQRRLSKILPSRFFIKVFFAEIKYGVHRSNGKICCSSYLIFFVVIDLRKLLI